MVVADDNDCDKLLQNGWITITVNAGLCNSMTSDLIISNNPCIESIYIHKNSLKYTNSVVISNNPQLQSIDTETPDFGSGDTGVFWYSNSFTIDSIF